MPTTQELAAQLLAIINEDKPRLEDIDDYIHGAHAEPYMPDNADGEYKLLAQRAVSNWIPLVIAAPAQALAVDGFRPSREVESERSTPEWKHWQDSGMDSKQNAVIRSALGYGHSFVVTEKTGKKNRPIVSRGLSPLRTAALFEDAANDVDPYAVLHVTRFPKGDDKGKGVMWDTRFRYDVTFEGLLDKDSIKISGEKRHGSSVCPVTRLAAAIDLEGRTCGVVEPMIPLQDRINQTIFDLLVAQTYASTKVRWATGMAPPLLRDTETGEPILDANGNPQAIPMNHNARRFLFAEDDTVNFGSLDESPLDGFIASVDMSIRHLAAISQTPPHHLLGQIANLSAEALLAAETSLSRKVAEFQKNFGESWERVFRIAGELAGDEAMATDSSGEVLWRDMEQRSLAQSADALGKMAEQLDIPKRGLWPRVPGVTQNEIDQWMVLREEDDFDLQMAESMQRAGAGFESAGAESGGGNPSGVAQVL